MNAAAALRRRGVLVGLAALITALVVVPSALAYFREYYLGSPESPITTNGVVGAFTSTTHFRLFNEAQAIQGGPYTRMGYARLVFHPGGTTICNETWYCVRYENAPNSKAECVVGHSTSGSGVTRLYCDSAWS